MLTVNAEPSVPHKHHVQKGKYALEELAFRDVEVIAIVRIMRFVGTKSVKMFARIHTVVVKMQFVKQLIAEKCVYVLMGIKETLKWNANPTNAV